MKVYIPKLGDVLELAVPWTFTVHSEYRNSSLIELAGLKMAERRWDSPPVGTFTFPKGAKLTVERIYIRQGGEAFDSVTFRARDYITSVSTGLKGKKEKAVRFWAKLDEVNTMDIVRTDSTHG